MPQTAITIILDTCTLCQGSGYGPDRDRDGNPVSDCAHCDGLGDITMLALPIVSRRGTHRPIAA